MLFFGHGRDNNTNNISQTTTRYKATHSFTMPKQIYATEELRLKAKRQATAKFLIKKGKKTLADYDEDWRSVKNPKPRTLLTHRATKAARMDDEFVPMVLPRGNFEEKFMDLFLDYYDFKERWGTMNAELFTHAENTQSQPSEIGRIIFEAREKMEDALHEAQDKWEAAMEKRIIKKQERKEEDDDDEIIILPKKKEVKKVKKTKGKKKLLIVE